MTLSRLGLTPPSSPQGRNMESSAEADHHQVLCLAMCKYEIIILSKMSHHFMFSPPASAFYAALQLASSAKR